MACNEKYEELLVDFIDGTLEKEDLAKVKSHISTCPLCAQDLEGLPETISQLKSLPEVAPPTELAAHIFEKTTELQTFGRRLLEMLKFKRQAPLTAAAMVLVACAAAVVVFSIPGLNQKMESSPMDPTVATAPARMQAAEPLIIETKEAEKSVVDDIALPALPAKSPDTIVQKPKLDGKMKKLESKPVDRLVDENRIGSTITKTIADTGGSEGFAESKSAEIPSEEIVADDLTLVAKTDIPTSTLSKMRNKDGLAAMPDRADSNKATEKSRDDSTATDNAPPPPPAPVAESVSRRTAGASKKSARSLNRRERGLIELTPVATGSGRADFYDSFDVGPALEEENSDLSDKEKKAKVSVSTPLSVTRNYDGFISGIHHFSTFLVLDDFGWQKLWAKMMPSVLQTKPAPNLDFSKQIVIGIFMGSKPTGGHAVKITRVVFVDKKLVVTAQITHPGPGQISTQAFTQPYSIVVVTPPDGISLSNSTPIDFIYE